MTADLTSLAERLEGATGPDRTLDADICLALGGMHSGHLWRQPGDVGWTGAPAEVTSSIDAALALVERKLGKHWCWQIKRAIGVEVILWTLETDYDEGHIPATGAHMNSVPIAILIALVRALSNPKART